MMTNDEKSVLFFLVLQILVIVISVLVLDATINVFSESLIEIKDLNSNLKNHYVKFSELELSELKQLRESNIDSLSELKTDRKSLLFSYLLSITSGILIGFLVVSTRS